MILTKDAKINYLNIGLMILSAGLSYFLPFETFLIAYAFLGPLHYLTEISWLHDRQYFSKGKYDYLVLLIIGILLSFAAFSQDFKFHTEIYDYFAKTNLFDKLLVLGLFSAFLFVFVKNIWIKLVAILFLYIYISGWLSPEATQGKPSTMIFALTSLLPTLIHVYLFTGLFMLFGALKARSKTGLLSIGFFILVPVFLVFFLPANSEKGNLTEYGKNAYYAEGNGFFYTNVSLMRQFEMTPQMTNKDYINLFVKDSLEKKEFNARWKNSMDKEFIIQNKEHPNYKNSVSLADAKEGELKDNWWDLVFFSSVGIMLMRFIAFAYLYHYLNWFSKTEVIRWHKVPKIRFIVIIALWLTACGLYLYDYSTGLSFLFFLSFTHVLLEFPLNITSIVGIGKESLAIARGGFSKKNE
ncbi:MAG TPA: hypothetical protein DCR46_08210 [Cytophagales bacterium]|jgi:hypothetical protein|nr:hypothetical protein [Cytophagales bacterium]